MVLLSSDRNRFHLNEVNADVAIKSGSTVPDY